MFNKREVMLGAGAFALAACVSEGRPGSADPEQWRQLPTEPYAHKQDDIFFISPQVGWYGNGDGKLYRTEDGGESWRKIWEQPGTFIRAVGFIDERNGFLGNLGAGFRPTITDSHPIYRTRDGGVSWTPVEVAGADAMRGTCAIDILPRRIIFQGQTQTTHLIHAAGRAAGPAMMVRSVDGGETWSAIDLRAHAGMILDVKFHDMDHGFLCAATSDDLEQSNAAILRTTDGGLTWTRVYQSSRPLELCWKMSWPSARVGYATVQNNNDQNAQQRVVKTIDGGATWQELPLASDPQMRELGVGFVDERRGWVGTSTGAFATRDGGRTWRNADIGRAVNKFRIVRDGRRFVVYAIGVTVTRLDGAM